MVSARRLVGLALWVLALGQIGCTQLNRSPSDGGPSATAGAGGSAATGAGGGAGSGTVGTTGPDAGRDAPPSTGMTDAGVDRGPAALPAALALAPLSKDFAAVVTGSGVAATFDVTNSGDTTSGLPSVAIDGADAAQFSIAANQCTVSLAPMAHCAISVRFAPSSTGPKSARLTVTGTPGGMVVATLGGSGAAAGALAISPSSVLPFISLPPQTASAPVTFTVTNSGDVATGPLAVSSSDPLDFPLDDGCGGKVLAGHSSCTVTVRFLPATAGPKSATLSVSATPGGATSVGLSGSGLRPGQLSATTDNNEFGMVEVGVATAAFSWTIRNIGEMPTGVPTLTNSNPLEIGVPTNGCTGALAAGASCTIAITLKATSNGAKSGTLSLSANPGGTLNLAVSATAGYRVTVTTQGTGTVTSLPTGIACGATCSALFDATQVTLQARPSNGSGLRFAGWSAASCAGVGRDCPLPLVASTSVTASFATVANNLVFITSGRFSTTLGSAAAYDVRCNTVATAAGINDLGGTDYVAFLADTGPLPAMRLGGARGWVRMDGRPFADTLASLLSNTQMWNAIVFDELGAATNEAVVTGATLDGQLHTNNCGNWTSSAATISGEGAFTQYGPGYWGSGTFLACNLTWPIICLGRTKTAAVSPPAITGRKIWLTNSAYLVGGGQTPDQKCQAERPTGVTTAVALLSRTDRPASALLVATTNYLRPDGVLVGTGAQITAGNLESGIWQHANGTYPSAAEYSWSGSLTPSAAGTTASTCGNWTDIGQIGAAWGVSNTVVGTDWWSATNGTQLGCDAAFWSLYCIQTAP